MNLKEITIDGNVYDLVPRKEAIPSENTILNSKNTGYERGREGEQYFFESNCYPTLEMYYDWREKMDNRVFNNAGYYTDEKLAMANIRADRLLRQLRRFSAMHRQNKIDWADCNSFKFSIGFDYEYQDLQVNRWSQCRYFGEVYFDTMELAEQAMVNFRDDLMWYFTEYKDTATFK
ncbi:MAG TPA: hypothetical protein DCW90_19775 [Lachnospiraceae bacterium]|nr:hypothetical protein [Lachnospiraceae bacterium]